jgi:acetate kinase
MASQIILSLNAGSSSLKLGLYRVDGGDAQILASGEAGGLGGDQASVTLSDGSGAELLREQAALSDPCAASGHMLDIFNARAFPQPDAVGHRVVHGGPHCLEHTLIDETVLADLDRARTFAPLHVPVALALIDFAQARFPGLKQVACFDTAFHAGMPEVARRLPLPRDLYDEGVHRYGFHGLSCESIVRQLGADLPDRLVVAHLGSGCSVTAIAKGRSIDTSMGLTPTGGTVMATRPGDLDPGVLLYLMREKHLDDQALETMLDRHSGLAGISGATGDMRRLRETAGTDPRAAMAIEIFCYAATKQIAAMAAALGGLDLLVFTGGIGEHDAATRRRICEGLGWMGIPQEDKAAPAGTCNVRVMQTDEDRQIALHTAALAFSECERDPGPARPNG